MPESKAPESASTAKSSLAQQVVDEAMNYVNRGNPYVWAGKGQELTDANIKSITDRHDPENEDYDSGIANQ